jgi:hypothetical protein
MTDCIEWQGARTTNGYGVRRAAGKIQYVHRLVWIEANGSIPEGMVVMHTCDNPPCYKLEHLRLGTQAENMQDAGRKGRMGAANRAKTHCINGHEFTPDNTWTNGKRRQCRTCLKERKRRYSSA